MFLGESTPAVILSLSYNSSDSKFRLQPRRISWQTLIRANNRPNRFKYSPCTILGTQLCAFCRLFSRRLRTSVKFSWSNRRGEDSPSGQRLPFPFFRVSGTTSRKRDLLRIKTISASSTVSSRRAVYLSRLQRLQSRRPPVTTKPERCEAA